MGAAAALPPSAMARMMAAAAATALPALHLLEMNLRSDNAVRDGWQKQACRDQVTQSVLPHDRNDMQYTERMFSQLPKRLCTKVMV